MKKIIFIAVTIIFFVVAVLLYYYFATASTLNQSYRNNVTEGLVGWWTFDGKDMTESTVTDKSGNSNHGTRTGATRSGAGKINQGLIPEAWGAVGYVSSTDSNSLDVTNFTLSAWVKRNEPSRLDSLMSKGSYGLKIGPDSRPYLEITNNTEGIVDVGQLGSNTYVYTLAVYNGKLYGGTYNSGRVYRYDGGTTWTDVGQLGSEIDVNTDVTSLVVYNGQLYGGTYDAGKVYRYDGGITWTDVGQLGSDTTVRSLAVYNGKLYGGTYNAASAALVYRYDGGTTWTSTGSPGSKYEITSLATYNGKLYGGFYGAGEIYSYDGNSWQNVGDPGGAVNTNINALSVFNGELYAATAISGKVYRYDGGTTWTDLGQLGADTFVYSLTVYNNKLYAGTAPSGNVYRFDGPSSWTSLGQLGTATDVNALTVYDGKLYAGVAASGKVYSIGNGAAVYGSTSLNTSFNHLAGSYEGTTLKLFINGSLDASSVTSTTVAATTDSLIIGSSHGSSGSAIGDENLNGIIDDVRIYNRALSSDEMKKIYRLGAGSIIDKTPMTFGSASNKTNLVGWWTFDGSATSTVANDRSGMVNHGTSYGAMGLAGKLGQGLYFDGASSTVQVADSDSLDVTNLTLSAWVKRNELSRVDSVISKGSYGLKVGADDRPYFEINNGTEGIANLGQVATSTAVYSSAVYNGKLYVGTNLNATVYRYDGGNTWTRVGKLPSTNTWVTVLAVYNGKLYGAGYFWGRVYRYDGGTTWTDCGQLAGAGINVHDLAVYDGKFYGAAGNGVTYGVYRYDGGTTWTNIFGATIAIPYTLAVYKGKLYAGTGSSGYVYRYDGGTTWTNVGQMTTLGGDVTSFAVYNNTLYGGVYSAFSIATSTGVYRFNDINAWTDVGHPGSATTTEALAVYNGKLYAGLSGGASGGYIYRYDGGTAWTSIGQAGTSTSVYNLTVYDGKMFTIGGDTHGYAYSIGSGAAVYGSAALTGFNHLAGTYDGTTVKLFVNGVMSTSTATSTTVATNTLPLLIGSSAGSSGAGIGEENLNGVIDDVRIYNQALSSDELRKLYLAGTNIINRVSDLADPLSINNGLVGWWTFDGSATSTVANDKSGYDRHGTLTGNTKSIPGVIGQAMSFKGASTDYINISPSFDLGTTYTCAGWVRFSVADTWEEVVGNGDATDYCIYLEYGSITHGVADGQVAWNYILGVNKWHHLVITRNGTSATLYVNGVSQGTQAGAGSASLTVSKLADLSNENQYRANDDIRLYNRILSPQEIMQLYRMGK